MTLIELFVVLLVITVLAVLILPILKQERLHARRIECVNNLKMCGLAFRVWYSGSASYFPMRVSETNGGTMEFVTGPNAFRHFQVMSNELSTPRILICPFESDISRSHATNWVDFNNSNLSYFVGVKADETDPQMILSGDRNITNGLQIRNGILELTSNSLAGWTAQIHNKCGNILLADGSVQQASTVGLRQLIAGSGVATNLVQMPVLK